MATNPLKGKMKFARTGGTLHVYSKDLADAYEAKLRREVQRSGDAIQWPDGSREFYTLDAVFSGSAEHGGYVWKGHKIKAQFVKHIVKRDGTHEQTVIREGFYSYERVAGE